MVTYKFKTTPFAHQLKAFNLSKERKSFALLMEMGTGKTKVIIDTAAYLYLKNKIKVLVIIAPQGVHSGWVKEQIPIHMPKEARCRGYIWNTGKAGTKTDAAEREDLLNHKGLIAIAINVEAVTIKKLKEWIKEVMDSKPTMLVVDESTIIKTPNAKRTKTVTNLGKHAEVRRILTGTPVTNSPFDLYSQYNFLDRKIIGMDSFLAFKHYYGEFGEEKYGMGKNRFGLQNTFAPLLGFKNIDELKKRIEPYSFRITKAQCLDLPPKTFMKRFIELPKETRRIYEQLQAQFKIEIEKEGIDIAVPMAITRLLRLQQITSGYFPVPEEEDPIHEIAAPDVRLEALISILQESTDQAVIWARFRPESEKIFKALSKLGKVCRYDGSVSVADRDDVVKNFRAGKYDWLVGNQRAGGRGLNLQTAGLVVGYSNTFSLEDRLQSEDRTHRIGMGDHCNYVDIIATDTVDEKIVGALRQYQEIANMITGDNVKEWI